jgi:hypothetical protein
MAHKTSSNPPLFIEVHVNVFNKESVWPFKSVLGDVIDYRLSIIPLFLRFPNWIVELFWRYDIFGFFKKI